MKLGGLGSASRGLRSLFDGGATAGLSDGQLLARFAGRSAEDEAADAAFEALMARHGPMVWGTCRRILRDSHAAEDAFQATFLILARKAGSIRVEDSLGRWLHGVGVRVALRARDVGARRRTVGIPPADLVDPKGAGDGWTEVRAVVDEEVARLPVALRTVVVLCHIEGLTRERAAAHLGCPPGTVDSRLARARSLLKARLTRRGMAPASTALAAWVGASAGSAFAAPPIPASLLRATLAAAPGGIAVAPLAGIVPAAVANLVRGHLRGTMMTTTIPATITSALLVGLAAAGLIAGGEPSAGGPPAVSPAAHQEPAPPPPAPVPSLAERVKAVQAEYKAASKAFYASVPDNATRAQRDEMYGRLAPREGDYLKRALDLADTDPANPAARDAWLWVWAEGARNTDGVGLRSLQLAQAASGLLAHHANDPRVARSTLAATNLISRNRDNLRRGLYEKATDREAKGVACLALGRYLASKATYLDFVRTNPVQPFLRYGVHDDAGKPIVVEGTVKQYDDEYWQHLRSCDKGAMQEEARSLLGRVIAEYGDIPYDPWKYEGDKVVRNPNPRPLASLAEAQLDDMDRLIAGEPAPLLAGTDLDGKPLDMAEHRGRVLLLVFWTAGCGPCLRDIPHERELIERYRDKPFSLLGVNCDEDLAAAIKVVRERGIAWPSFADGADGPMYARFHVPSFPTVVVIDAKGILHAKKASMGDDLDKLIERLVAEALAERSGSR